MPTLFILSRWIIAAAVVAAILPCWVRAQSALSEAGVGNDSGFLIELEAYAKYGGDITDCITGQYNSLQNEGLLCIGSGSSETPDMSHESFVAELKERSVEVTMFDDETPSLDDVGR